MVWELLTQAIRIGRFFATIFIVKVHNRCEGAEDIVYLYRQDKGYKFTKGCVAG